MMAILEAGTLALQQRTDQTSTLEGIPEGAAGTRATLDRMVRLTKQYAVDLAIRNLAESIIAHVPSKDYDGEICAIQQWVRNNIRYTRDVFGVETIKTPDELVSSGQGDCDDHSLLVGTLAASIGFPVRYVAIGYQGPGLFEHVFAEVQLGWRPRSNTPNWLSVETTEPVAVGHKFPQSPAYMVRHV